MAAAERGLPLGWRQRSSTVSGGGAREAAHRQLVAIEASCVADRLAAQARRFHVGLAAGLWAHDGVPLRGR